MDYVQCVGLYLGESEPPFWSQVLTGDLTINKQINQKNKQASGKCLVFLFNVIFKVQSGFGDL